MCVCRPVSQGTLGWGDNSCRRQICLHLAWGLPSVICLFYPLAAPPDGQITGLPHNPGSYCVWFPTAQFLISTVHFCNIVAILSKNKQGYKNCRWMRLWTYKLVSWKKSAFTIHSWTSLIMDLNFYFTWLSNLVIPNIQYQCWYSKWMIFLNTNRNDCVSINVAYNAEC